MFEERSISILSYNLETVLGEKMETILSRADANTRMRDYYDIYVLLNEKRDTIRSEILRAAFEATCRKRNTLKLTAQVSGILNAVKDSEVLKRQWENYRKSSYYVGQLEWKEVFAGTEELAKMLQMI